MEQNPPPPPQSTEELPHASCTSFLPSLPAEGFLRHIRRVLSFFRRILGRDFSADVPAVASRQWTSPQTTKRPCIDFQRPPIEDLTDLPNSVLCIVFQGLPIQDILSCSMACKAFKSVIESEEFRSSFRRASVFTAPIVAVFGHLFSTRTIPVAIPAQSPFQNLQLGLDFGKEFPFIADVRDGYMLLYNGSYHVKYQRFLLANPVTRVMEEIPKPPYNPLYIYIAAGFIPSDDSFDYEIVVLYAHKTGGSRELTTAVFDSKENSWETVAHTLDQPAPKSKDDIKLPSILIGRKWSILLKGSYVLTTDMILPPFTVHPRSRAVPRVTIRISAIPVPTPQEAEARSIDVDSVIGKSGEHLCFIWVEPEAEGLQIWRCDLSSPVPYTFSSPIHYHLGVKRALLVGFAEANNIVIVQPDILVEEQALLINISSNTQDLMMKDGLDIVLFGYELEWPPTRPRPSSARG